MINIVRTKGKAGYLFWKLAGGQGAQDINLPWGSFEITFFFDFFDIKLSVANPLLINQINQILTNTYQKGVYIILFNLSCFLLESRGDVRGQNQNPDHKLLKHNFWNKNSNSQKQPKHNFIFTE